MRSSLIMKKTSKLFAEQLARERGIPVVSENHPIYSEGASVVFLRGKPDRTPEKDKVNREKELPYPKQ